MVGEIPYPIGATGVSGNLPYRGRYIRAPRSTHVFSFGKFLLASFIVPAQLKHVVFEQLQDVAAIA